MKHFLQLQRLIEGNKVDPSRIFNLDESGCSPRDFLGNRVKVFTGKDGRNRKVDPCFGSILERISYMPVVSADGRHHRLLVVLPGIRSRWRKVLVNGREQHESPRDFLPHGSVVLQRTPAGVDSAIFLKWLPIFLEDTRHLRANGQKMLLIYDGYKSDVNLNVINMLMKEQALAYPREKKGAEIKLFFRP